MRNLASFLKYLLDQMVSLRHPDILEALIINNYVSLMYKLKKNGKVFTSKSVGTGPSSCENETWPRSHKG